MPGGGGGWGWAAAVHTARACNWRPPAHARDARYQQMMIENDDEWIAQELEAEVTRLENDPPALRAASAAFGAVQVLFAPTPPEFLLLKLLDPARRTWAEVIASSSAAAQAALDDECADAEARNVVEKNFSDDEKDQPSHTSSPLPPPPLPLQPQLLVSPLSFIEHSSSLQTPENESEPPFLSAYSELLAIADDPAVAIEALCGEPVSASPGCTQDVICQANNSASAGHSSNGSSVEENTGSESLASMAKCEAALKAASLEREAAEAWAATRARTRREVTAATVIIAAVREAACRASARLPEALVARRAAIAAASDAEAAKKAGAAANRVVDEKLTAQIDDARRKAATLATAEAAAHAAATTSAACAARGLRAGDELALLLATETTAAADASRTATSAAAARARKEEKACETETAIATHEYDVMWAAEEDTTSELAEVTEQQLTLLPHNGRANGDGLSTATNDADGARMSGVCAVKSLQRQWRRRSRRAVTAAALPRLHLHRRHTRDHNMTAGIAAVTALQARARGAHVRMAINNALHRFCTIGDEDDTEFTAIDIDAFFPLADDARRLWEAEKAENSSVIFWRVAAAAAKKATAAEAASAAAAAAVAAIAVTAKTDIEEESKRQLGPNLQVQVTKMPVQEAASPAPEPALCTSTKTEKNEPVSANNSALGESAVVKSAHDWNFSNPKTQELFMRRAKHMRGRSAPLIAETFAPRKINEPVPGQPLIVHRVRDLGDSAALLVIAGTKPVATCSKRSRRQ